MTEEDRADRIKALLRERAGYEQRGNQARVDAVNAELTRLGHGASAPQKRADKRPRPPAETRGAS